MARRLRSSPLEVDAAHADAVSVIADRLAAQREQLARRIVDASRLEIVDYRVPTDPRLLDEQRASAVGHIDALVESLKSGEPVPDEYFVRVREVGARRMRQGVPLESIGRAARLWATICWQGILTVARVDSPREREAALAIAARVFDLGDRISIVLAQAFLDEITDRGLLRRDLLEALLTAQGDDDHTVRLAGRLHLQLEDSYAVVVVRGQGLAIEESRDQSPAAQSRLDRIVEETRRAVRPSTGAALTGMRSGDLVVLYPA